MSKETQELLKRIADERNIAIEVLEEAIHDALISASKKMIGGEIDIVRADSDPETGEYRVFASKEVVEDVGDDFLEISLPEARLYKLDAKLGDSIEIDVTPHDFGRIAAQNAKQVVTQRIREAEREMVYERYYNRVGDLVTGTVQQYERGNVIIDIGYAEALLPFSEQPRGERYHYGDRVRAVILEVNESTRDAQVILSRKTIELVRKLFEQEVTEVRDGTVVIREVAREPGRRTKIAVMSTNLDVDPVGACVGMKGSRVQMVVQELKGERIDIIPYSQDKAKFIQNSLKPAEVESVELDEEGAQAMLTVKDDQLSLAIGKGGLNAKLASELTGTEIDIVSVSELEASERETRAMLSSLPGADEETVEELMSLGLWSYDNILEYGVEGMVETLSMEEDLATRIHAAAEKFVSGEETPAYLLENEDEAGEDEAGEDESEVTEDSEEEVGPEEIEATDQATESESDEVSVEEVEATDQATESESDEVSVEEVEATDQATESESNEVSVEEVEEDTSSAEIETTDQVDEPEPDETVDAGADTQELDPVVEETEEVATETEG